MIVLILHFTAQVPENSEVCPLGGKKPQSVKNLCLRGSPSGTLHSDTSHPLTCGFPPHQESGDTGWAPTASVPALSPWRRRQVPPVRDSVP